ncbi:MAG: GDP-L-fucose synthase [Patescibacteria group bacterium]
MEKKSKIYVAGHRGLVGSAIVRALHRHGFKNIIVRSHKELDLLNQSKVATFFKKEKPEYVFLAAAKVGGIMANDTLRGDFIYQNLMIQSNIIHSSYINGVKKLLFLGSSCIYPRLAPQPLKEEYLLTGPLEETNKPYALAKIAGSVMCESYNKQYGTNFISAMPTNLYGEGDNFDLETSHVLPALIHKFDAAKNSGAKEITLWGSGKPKREFLHVDDLAEACLFLMQSYKGNEPINVGTGKDLSIKALAEMIKKIAGFKGKILWDSSKPDGTPRKLLNIEKIKKLGWKPTVSLEKGIGSTYEWYKQKNK